MKNLAHNLFLFFLLGFVFWPFFTPGERVANDFPYTFTENVNEITLPQTWSSRFSEGLGENVVVTLSTWPNDLLYWTGARLGISPNILIRVLRFLPILIIGFWAQRRLLNFIGLRKTGIFIGTLLYLLNTYILILIDGGQYSIGMAYAWFPIAYLAIIKAVNGNLSRKILSGLAVSVLGILDIRFIYLLFLLIFLKTVYDLFFERETSFLNFIFLRLTTALTILLVFIGLNIYWLSPSAIAKAQVLPETYERVSQTSFLSFSNIGHALFLLQPHWYKNVFGKVTPIRWEFVFIPILIFIAPVLKKKNKEVGFWLLTSLVSIFLVKGANPPLPGLYPWLFTHIPGFSLFRDPTKFFFLVALSYSALIGFTADELIKKFNWSFRIGPWSLKVIPLLLTTYFLLIINPVWSGKMTGTFSEPLYKRESFKIAEILKNDIIFGRIFWIPSRSILGYSSTTHPSLDAERVLKKRPFEIGAVGTYEIFNFLRDAPFMGEIFKIAGIKYISYPYPDTRREELKQDNIDYYYSFLDQLTNLPWVETKISDPPVPVLKVKNSKDHFFIADNTFLVVGSDGIYNNLAKIQDFNLSKNALIFAEEKPGLSDACNKASCKAILFDKNKIDFAATFIDKSRFVFPAQKLGFDPDESGWPASNALRSNAGWWKRETSDFLWLRNFLQTKYGLDNQDFDYGGGWAVAEGDLKLQIANNKLQKGNILLARVMESSRGGKVEFLQGDIKIGEIDTKIEEPEKVEINLTGYKDIPDQIFSYDKADFRWFEVGWLPNNDKMLTIKTEGDINVVNALVSLPQDEWLRINGLSHQYNVVEWNKLSDLEKENLFTSETLPTVSYQRINPTHYKVKVTKLTKPATLAFSESYDPLWEMGGQKSYPLYSLINGFMVNKDGEYDIYYTPQKYVLPGLLVSGLTLAAIITLLLIVKKKTLQV